MARPLPRFTVPLAAVAVLAPVALGVATHLEHRASARPAIVIAPKEIVPVAVPTPAPTTVVIAPDFSHHAPRAVEPPPEVAPAVEVVPEAETPSVTIEPAPPAEVPGFFFTVRAAGKTYVVLSQEIEDAWATSDAEAIDEWGQTVQRGVDMDALPTELASWHGQRIDTYGGDGLACPARIGDYHLLGQAHGDLVYEIDELEDTEDAWESGEYDAVMRENAPVIWDVGRKLLVAEVDGRYGCVAGAQLALAHTEATPLVYRPDRSRGAANFEPTRRAVLKTDRFEELAVEYEQYTQDPDPALGISAKQPKLRRYTDATAWFTPEGEAQLVSVIVDGEVFGPCGGLPRPWGVARVGEGGDAVIGDAAADEWGDVIAVMDLDGDGNPEILADGWDRQLLRLVDGKLETVSELEAVPFFGCPC